VIVHSRVTSGGRVWWVTTIVWNACDALVKVWNSFRVATVEEDAEIVEEQEGRAFHAVHLRHRDRRFQECYVGAPAGLVQPYRVWCGPEPDLGYPVADIDTSDLAADASGHVPQNREESVPVKAQKRCPVIDSGRGSLRGLMVTVRYGAAVEGARRSSWMSSVPSSLSCSWSRCG
jgi:hypothetical protein